MLIPPKKIITKSQLKSANFPDVNIEELCGPASITMLLEMKGYSLSLQEVVHTMSRYKAFVPGVGVVLSRVPRCFQVKLIYMPYVPTWLLKILLQQGYVGAHSVKNRRDLGGHIVLVYAYKDEVLHTCDPNSSNTEPVFVDIEDWRQYSNHRAVFLRSKD